jgi:hypothetical protein
MLVASLALLSCERPTASRGHEPTSCYDTTSALAATPLKIEEPLYRFLELLSSALSGCQLGFSVRE